MQNLHKLGATIGISISIIGTEIVPTIANLNASKNLTDSKLGRSFNERNNYDYFD